MMNMIALGRNIFDHVNMLLVTTNLALYIDICIEQKYEIWPWNQNMIVKLFEPHAYNDPNWVSLWDVSKLNYWNGMRKIHKFKKKKWIEIQKVMENVWSMGIEGNKVSKSFSKWMNGVTVLCFFVSI